MVEGIIPETPSILKNVKKTLVTVLQELCAEEDMDALLAKRYEKFRKIGVFQEINQI